VKTTFKTFKPFKTFGTTGTFGTIGTSNFVRYRPIDFATEGLLFAHRVGGNCGIRAKELSRNRSWRSSRISIVADCKQ
jgi:hypothetical protein